MKLIVVTNEKGDIESVTTLKEKYADRLNMETDQNGMVHKLDLEDEAVTEEALQGKKGHKARTKALKILKRQIRTMAASTRDL